MMKPILLWTILLASASANSDETIEKYSGTAKNKKGEIVYIENHTTSFNDKGRVLKAETDYVDKNGTLLGHISSDFTSKLTAPAHAYTDARTKEQHGIRYDGDKIILFLKEKNGKEETKTFTNEIAEGGIIVGCQGLHYYLRENFDDVVSKKSIPVKMLIPGKLDYYSFNMKYIGEKDGLVEFNIAIDSFFLKLFAPSLTIKYDKATRHLVHYEGLSNILDADGEIQNVEITYDYSTKKS